MGDGPFIDEHPDEAIARRLSRAGLFLALLPVGGCAVQQALLRKVGLFDPISIGTAAWAVTCCMAFVGAWMALLSNRIRPSSRARWAMALGVLTPLCSLWAYGLFGRLIIDTF